MGIYTVCPSSSRSHGLPTEHLFSSSAAAGGEQEQADLFDLGITLDLLLNGSKYVLIDRGIWSGRFGHC
jgi:hypothetical protein